MNCQFGLLPLTCPLDWVRLGTLTVLLFALSALLGCSVQSTSEASVGQSPEGHDWPGFLGPGQDGISSVTGIRTDWSDGNLPVLWTRDLGQGYAPGTVAGNHYYHFDRVGREARLVCLNSSTGEEIWQFKYSCNYRDMYGYDGGPRSCPVVDGDTVYIYGPGGMFHALKTENGHVKWSHDLSERFGVHQNFFGVGSPPVVFEDKVLVMVGGSPEDNQITQGALDQATPNHSAIVALDRNTGEQVYQLGNDLASYSAIKLARHDDRDWAFAWARESLIAFDPANGSIDFEFPWRARMLESVNASTPVVDDGHVFLSECYGVGSVMLKFGESVEGKHELVWKDQGRDKSMMTHWNTSIFRDGFLYGSSGRHSKGATLRCIEASSGNVRWSKEGYGRCNMTFVDGYLAVQAEGGALFLVRANPDAFELVTTYQPGARDRNRIRLTNPCWAAPVIANGKMYVRGKSQLICLELVAP